MSTTDIPVDVEVLREEIRKTYSDVSTDQEQEFIFPTGRAWAQELGYPEPERLMYLTTQFPAFGFDQFWVSPPEYFEFRELTQSFASVGAYTTGEVNLTAGDRPLRVRSASVDDALLRTLGVQPIAGRGARPVLRPAPASLPRPARSRPSDWPAPRLRAACRDRSRA